MNDKIVIKGANSLKDVVNFLNYGEDLLSTDINYCNLKENNQIYDLDFSEVKGQETAKRAIEIAAAGGHNCCMIGHPRLWKIHACSKITNYFT